MECTNISGSDCRELQFKVETKSLKDLFILVKATYIEEIRSRHIGICGAIFLLQFERGAVLSQKEALVLMSIIREESHRRSIFFTYSGEKTNQKDQFLWPMNDCVSRIEWLDQKINELN